MRSLLTRPSTAKITTPEVSRSMRWTTAALPFGFFRATTSLAMSRRQRARDPSGAMTGSPTGLSNARIASSS